MPTQRQKFKNILRKNTFFLNAPDLERKWETEISSLVDLILLIKQDLKGKNIKEKKEYLIEFITNKPNGLSALLCLFGVSTELLLRILTFTLVIKDKDLNTLVNKKNFPDIKPEKWRRKLVFKQVRKIRCSQKE